MCEPAFPQIYKPEIISSDSTGVTLELSVGNFSVNMKEIDGRNYHLISYNDCSYTSEVGKPLLPIFPATIGIPPNASIAINLIDTQFSEIGGYLPYPVPKKVIKSSDFSSNIDGANNRIESLVDSFTIDDRFYGKNVVYPSETVSLSYQGYIRNQRIASLEFHPIQYNPATRMLRKYKKIIAKVNFTTNKSAPYYSAALKPDKEFELSLIHI